MAAYRSSSSASTTLKSVASAVVCHQREVASLACGATMRAATMASTSSRSRQGLEASNEARPRRCIAKATACTAHAGASVRSRRPAPMPQRSRDQRIGQMREIAQGLVLDAAAFAVAVPQQVGAVHLFLKHLAFAP